MYERVLVMYVAPTFDFINMYAKTFIKKIFVIKNINIQ